MPTTPRVKTSISESAARRLAEKAEPGTFLFCDRVAGLHLKALKRPGLAAWRWRYTDPTGRRRVIVLGKFPAMSPAAAAARALECLDTDPFAEREAQRQEQRRAAANTVGAYLKGAYALHQSRKKGGAATLRRIKVAFPELLDRPMSSLRPADVKDWQARREAAGAAHATLQRDLGALKTMLNHAARQDPPLIDTNPLARVTLERPAEDARTQELAARRGAARRLLTDDELRGLFTGLAALAEECRRGRRNSRAHGKAHLPDLEGVTCSHWFVPFTYLALYTGLRPGDLYTLTWQELNVPFSRLVKVPEKTRHHPAPARVQMTLAGPLRPVVAEWWKLAGEPTEGLVFPSRVKGQPMDRKAHGKPWRRVQKLGGLPEELTFYALRHHFISAMVAGGVPLFTVARLAGHKGVAMIEQNYGHLCPDAAADALTIFENSLPAEEGLRPSRSQQ